MGDVIDCWVNPFTPEIAERAAAGVSRARRDRLLPPRRRGVPRHAARRDGGDDGAAAASTPALLTIDAANPAPMAEAAARYGDRFLLSAVIDPTQGMDALRTVERLVQRLRRAPHPHDPVPDQQAAERQGVLPGLRQVHRARRRRVGQHRHPRTADAGRAAAPALPRRGLPLLPRARPDHGARRRSVVGRGDPPAAQVSRTST